MTTGVIWESEAFVYRHSSICMKLRVAESQNLPPWDSTKQSSGLNGVTRNLWAEIVEKKSCRRSKTQNPNVNWAQILGRSLNHACVGEALQSPAVKQQVDIEGVEKRFFSAGHHRGYQGYCLLDQNKRNKTLQRNIKSRICSTYHCNIHNAVNQEKKSLNMQRNRNTWPIL